MALICQNELALTLKTSNRGARQLDASLEADCLKQLQGRQHDGQTRAKNDHTTIFNIVMAALDV